MGPFWPSHGKGRLKSKKLLPEWALAGSLSSIFVAAIDAGKFRQNE
jgi:hypothetical protein